jgi:uncharacterized protein with GYD domain
MANYLLQVGYRSEAWANLITDPHDRIDADRPVVEKLGGSFTHSWFAFGDYDIVAIVDVPGNVEAEGVEAMKKAAKSGYKASARAARA